MRPPVLSVALSLKPSLILVARNRIPHLGEALFGLAPPGLRGVLPVLGEVHMMALPVLEEEGRVQLAFPGPAVGLVVLRRLLEDQFDGLAHRVHHLVVLLLA